MSARRKGSARFEPYFKLERRDVVLNVWKPVARRFATLEDVHAFVRDAGVHRVTRVSESAGYEVLGTIEDRLKRDDD